MARVSQSSACVPHATYSYCDPSMLFQIIKSFVCAALLGLAANGYALQLRSEHAIVINNETGAVVLEKGANEPVPIASLTKLMTAMVVLDSKPDMNERIAIDATDVDLLKHSKSHVPVGSTMARRQVLQLALMS